MSPEQSEGDGKVTARSDVYSLASVTYEMLTGEPPYSGPTARAVMTKRMTDPVPSARRLRRSIPPAFDQAIVRALAPTPADRFATAGAFAAALDASTTDLQPASPGWRRGAAAAVVGIVVLGAGFLAYRRGSRDTARPGVVAYMERGNALLARRTPDAFADAIREYEAALALDSTNATALARIGYAYTLFVDWAWPYQGMTLAALRARAMTYSEKALSYDSSSAEAWLTRAYVLAADDPFRLRGAPEAFRRALVLDSTSAEGWYQYGQALQVLGRGDDAAAAYRRAFALDPNRPMTLMSLSALSLRKGRIDEARRLIDSAISSSTTVTSPYVRVVHGLILLADKEAGLAEREGELALEMDTAYRIPARSLLTMVYVAQGRAEKARAQADTLRRELGSGDPSPTSARFAASALLALGEREAALRLIEAATPRGATLWFYLQSRELASLRSDPRFRKVYQEADPTGPPPGGP
jgi:tetratricopeptide (TPR) repeat protein